MGLKNLKKEIGEIFSKGKELGRQYNCSSFKDLSNCCIAVVTDKPYKASIEKTTRSFEEEMSVENSSKQNNFVKQKKSFFAEVFKIINIAKKNYTQNQSAISKIEKIEKLVELYQKSPGEFEAYKVEILKELVVPAQENSFTSLAE